MEIVKLVEEFAPALRRMKLLRGTTAAAAAEQLLGEADHGFIPVFKDGQIIVSELSGKSPTAGCTWSYEEENTKDAGIIIYYWGVTAFTKDKHWVSLNKNGDRILDADPNFRHPLWSNFWRDKSEFVSGWFDSV